MDVQPGDVLAVNTHSFWGWFIRFGAWIRRQDSKHDHIVVIYNRDAVGVLWGLEARPGGVGWVDVEKEYDRRSWVTNVGQIKTQAQRQFVIDHAKLFLGTRYDWEAIALAGVQAVGWSKHAFVLELMARYKHITEDFKETAPLDVICSSMAVWLYHHTPDGGLDYPNQHGERWTTPADWVDWMKVNSYDR